MTTRTWQQIIDAVPEVHPGQRGVSAEIEAALAYIRRQDLAITRRDRLNTHIARQLPSCQRVLSYHPGGRGQAAYYSEPERIVPGERYRQARIQAASLGLRAEYGIIWRTLGRRRRLQMRYNGSRWVRVRTWRIERDDDCRIAVAPSIRWRYATARAVAIRSMEEEHRPYWRITLRGRTHTVRRTGRTADHRCIVADIIREQRIERERRRALPTPTIMRAMRRLCPREWEVVCTPATTGAAPSPAYRERESGEEYHISTDTRRWVSLAEEAFRRRYAQRMMTELAELIERAGADDVWVCLADSRRAGNCDTGTRQWAGRNHLDITRHYTIGELRQHANGDWRYVRAAAIQAIRRHRTECQRGYAMLADHT